MDKYWQSNPNHKESWGEAGGLPIDRLTISQDDHVRAKSVYLVALLTNEKKKAITDSNGDFVLVGEINIIYGGAGGKAPIYARERQLERELPGLGRPYTNVVSDVNTANPPSSGPYLAFDGSNWFVSDNPLVGMTPGYFTQDGFGNIHATTGVGVGLSFIIDGLGNVIVTI